MASEQRLLSLRRHPRMSSSVPGPTGDPNVSLSCRVPPRQSSAHDERARQSIEAEGEEDRPRRLQQRCAKPRGEREHPDTDRDEERPEGDAARREAIAPPGIIGAELHQPAHRRAEQGDERQFRREQRAGVRGQRRPAEDFLAERERADAEERQREAQERARIGRAPDELPRDQHDDAHADGEPIEIAECIHRTSPAYGATTTTAPNHSHHQVCI
jgi:hypothetical protein